jgi:DNA-binding transcriptional ArsR family regulator
LIGRQTGHQPDHVLLLKEKPLSTGEIAEKLGLNPSDVSRHMNSSSRHGLVRYDESRNCYADVICWPEHDRNKETDLKLKSRGVNRLVGY